MNAPAAEQGVRLALLTFSFGKATFGIDTDQLAGMSLYRGEEEDDLVWLHQELGYREPPSYRDPRVVSVKGGDPPGAPPYRLVIEAPEDIVEFDSLAVRPFPTLVEPYLLPHGLWGVLPVNDKMILLLDCHRRDTARVIG